MDVLMHAHTAGREKTKCAYVTEARWAVFDGYRPEISV